MPFRLRVSRVEYTRKELAITGRLTRGACYGPECVTLWGEDGTCVDGFVSSHLMTYPEGWPVLPEHSQTELTLHVPLPSRGFRLDESRVLVGRGSMSILDRRDFEFIAEVFGKGQT